MSGVGRLNCRASNAEIVYFIGKNGKPGKVLLSRELSEIIVDLCERSRFSGWIILLFKSRQKVNAHVYNFARFLPQVEIPMSGWDSLETDGDPH
jgi:hypothetical protein